MIAGSKAHSAAIHHSSPYVIQLLRAHTDHALVSRLCHSPWVASPTAGGAPSPIDQPASDETWRGLAEKRAAALQHRGCIHFSTMGLPALMNCVHNLSVPISRWQPGESSATSSFPCPLPLVYAWHLTRLHAALSHYVQNTGMQPLRVCQ